MPLHSDPDDLALRALGEDVPGTDEHLAACPQCRDELDTLRSVVAVARTVEEADAPQDPPPGVWAAVSTELGLGRPAAGADATAPGPDEVRDELAARRAQPRSWLRPVSLAAAALVGLLVGVGATLVATRDSGSTVVVAATVLRPLEGEARSGDAEILRTADGRQLELDLRDLPAGEGYLEVWLLDKEHKRLVPVGLLEGTRGRFTIPEGIDLGEYPVVDVSLEPADGDPAHSGNSLARGTLPT